MIDNFKDFYQRCPILHVDGSVSEITDSIGKKRKVIGLGGYFKNIKSSIKFSKCLKNMPYPDCHEHYAVLEGLIIAKKNNIKNLRILSDSVETINLMTLSKKINDERDYYFLSMYLPVSNWFNYIEFEYFERDGKDLAHILSREYLNSKTEQFQMDLLPNRNNEEEINNYMHINNYLSKFLR